MDEGPGEIKNLGKWGIWGMEVPGNGEPGKMENLKKLRNVYYVFLFYFSSFSYSETAGFRGWWRGH
jgi:hypothetical protein